MTYGHFWLASLPRDCKQLAPVWDALAVELEGEIYVAKVKCPSLNPKP